MSYPQANASGPDAAQKLSDEACSRLMEIYVQEAEQYDKGLVQSWQDDMDVTLVFSGLYSAVLTAFVIESYRKLQEDPGDASVALLYRISDQLASLSNSTSSNTITKVPNDVFAPTLAATACNVLWFLSLILALCCAFLATFVQQWSRQFKHKTGQLRSSTAHARLFSFLYFGLKNFRMHTVVNVIPSMLHLSLFLFLGGLIAFLRDVNPVLMYIVVGALAIVTAVYVGFTVWPVIALNAPCQTPFSPIVWTIWQLLTHTTFPFVGRVWEVFGYTTLPIARKAQQIFSSKFLPFAKNVFKKLRPGVTCMFTRASPAIISTVLPTRFNSHYPTNPPSISHRFIALNTRCSASFKLVLARAKIFVSSIYTLFKILPILPVVYEPRRGPEKLRDLADEVLAASQKPDPQRDIQAITWTLSSLTNDRELLPFIEALPDAIYGPAGVHDHNLYLIKPFVETADTQANIILRIVSVMTNASNAWFDENHRTRCSIACPKALWALAFMFSSRTAQFDLVKAPHAVWFPDHVLLALAEANEEGAGDTLDRKYATSAMVICMNASSIYHNNDAKYRAGSAVRKYLQTSIELEPFEFHRTSLALRQYLSGVMASERWFRYGLFPSFADGPGIGVPNLETENPLVPEQMARCNVVVGHYLQVPNLPDRLVTLLLDFINGRAKIHGWGSTLGAWERWTNPRALDQCAIDIHLLNALRECLYALLPSDPDDVTPGTRHLEEPVVTCIRALDRCPNNAEHDNNDISQFALETMVAMRVILVDAPEEMAEISKDFKFACQFVKQNVLHPETKGDVNSVKASSLVILITRLLRRFLTSTGDPLTVTIILETLEFILYLMFGNHVRPFDIPLNHLRSVYLVPNRQATIESGVAETFSEYTLAICEWWGKADPKHLSRNTWDIISWIWVVWAYIKLPQSKEATQNLAKAAELMLSVESIDKVEAAMSEQPNRVPAPSKEIAEELRFWYFRKCIDFQHDLDRYIA